MAKQNWKPYQAERERYDGMETQGFTKDMKALRSHILKLQRVCPKDAAGWPDIAAQTYIIKLQERYFKINAYIKDCFTNQEATKSKSKAIKTLVNSKP